MCKFACELEDAGGTENGRANVAPRAVDLAVARSLKGAFLGGVGVWRGGGGEVKEEMGAGRKG